MHIALVEHPQNDIHREQRGQNEPGLAVQRILECPRGSLEAAMNARRNADSRQRVLDGERRLPERCSLREIERNRRRNELRLMIHAERRIGRDIPRKRGQGNLRLPGRAHVHVIERGR